MVSLWGDESKNGGAVVRVCCGPRCGAEPGHRLIYAAVERAAEEDDVRPIMCRGLCGCGVTLILPDGCPVKARDAAEARALLNKER